MSDVYVLEWKFTPADYFEEAVELECEHGVIHVMNGVARCVVPAAQHTDLGPRELWAVLHQELEVVFLAAEAFAHKPYTLEKPSFERHNSNGTKHYTLMAETLQFSVKVQNLNFGDQRDVRIHRRRKFVSLVSRFSRDATASKMLRSYQAAVNNPSTELVHLYEIRDALKQHFGSERAAKDATGIPSGKWNRLGTLANEPSLRQGRHRGLELSGVRDATSNELEEARALCLEFIESYLRHLGVPT